MSNCGLYKDLSGFVDAGGRAENTVRRRISKTMDEAGTPIDRKTLVPVSVPRLVSRDSTNGPYGVHCSINRLMAILFVLASSQLGCAIDTPSQVFRFTADYNTERRFSVQGEVFEHLPSHPVRVRLNRWAYNVGPQVSTSSIPIPANSPVTPPPTPVIAPPLPPQPGLSEDSDRPQEDLLEESRPPRLPPDSWSTPRTDLRNEERGNGRGGPSARANGNVRGASYEVTQGPVPAEPPPAGVWLFGR